MSNRSQVAEAFDRLIGSKLRADGFVGGRGHWLRRVEGTTQIVELQHSIYGGRITANLGLDLEWLRPLVRWIARPDLGPHAHDAVRWIRIGLASPEKSDHWWSYEDSSIPEAVSLLGEQLTEHGLNWLESQQAPESFLEHAHEGLARSVTDRHPDGGFVELRLVAAILAWSGNQGDARKYANKARACWAEERERLARARKDYKRRHPDAPRRLAPVPDLLDELDAIISTTKDARTFQARPRKGRGSRSGQR